LIDNYFFYNIFYSINFLLLLLFLSILSENIQTKSSSFFSNVSSFIKRYQPQQTPATVSDDINANVVSTAADIGIIAEPQKTKMSNDSSKDNI